jgi:hypothetical protein
MRGRAPGGGKSFKGLKPIKVSLWSIQGAASSGAASALSLNSALTFNSSTFPELSSFSQIYDEVRILRARLHYHPFVQTLATVTTLSDNCTFTGAYAIEFDPSISGPSSINQVQESTYSSPVLFVTAYGLNSAGSPSIVPYRTLDAPLPPPMAAIVASDCVGRAWFTVDVTPPVVCVMNGYHSALTTTGVTGLLYYWELECEFKMRT